LNLEFRIQKRRKQSLFSIRLHNVLVMPICFSRFNGDYALWIRIPFGDAFSFMGGPTKIYFLASAFAAAVCLCIFLYNVARDFKARDETNLYTLVNELIKNSEEDPKGINLKPHFDPSLTYSLT